MNSIGNSMSNLNLAYTRESNLGNNSNSPGPQHSSTSLVIPIYTTKISPHVSNDIHIF